jgi:hypothetical protein
MRFARLTTLATLALLAAPLAAKAQQAGNVPRIGYLVHCPVSSGPTPGDISWGAWDRDIVVGSQHKDGPSPSRAFA